MRSELPSSVGRWDGMGYVNLRVSVWRSEFSSHMFKKNNGTADTSFSEDRDAHSSFLNEILPGRAEKRCLSPWVFLSAMDEWHPEKRQTEWWQSCSAWLWGSGLCYQWDRAGQHINPSAWAPTAADSSISLDFTVPSPKLRKKYSKGRAYSLCLQVLLMLWSLWACKQELVASRKCCIFHFCSPSLTAVRRFRLVLWCQTHIQLHVQAFTSHTVLLRWEGFGDAQNFRKSISSF